VKTRFNFRKPNLHTIIHYKTGFVQQIGIAVENFSIVV